jgi:hypothetical protein
MKVCYPEFIENLNNSSNNVNGGIMDLYNVVFFLYAKFSEEHTASIFRDKV